MKEQNQFYKWMQKIGNIYLNDNQKMCNAFQRIAENKVKKPKKINYEGFKN